MLLGVVIGTEREYTHRPAGMRTHMLVSLGACAVMVTGQLIFNEYRPYGSMPNPARLSAQVITGVGFLGAGTIIREGSSIKGLTTAASLWAVACLGVAIGGGYYAVGLIGAICMMITLTLFEAIQKLLMKSRYELYSFQVVSKDAAGIWEQISDCAQKQGVEIKGMQMTHLEDSVMQLSFKIDFSGKNSEKRFQQFAVSLGSDARTESLQTERCRV